MSFSDSNQGTLIHLKGPTNKTTLSPRKARDLKSDRSGKKRSQTRSPINPIKEEANEGKAEEVFQIKRYNMLDSLKEDENDEGARPRRISIKDIDRYLIEGESFKVVVHKDKDGGKQTTAEKDVNR